MLRPVRKILQTPYMSGVIAPFPAVESLRGNIEVTTGEAGILFMRIVVKPLESLPGIL